MTSRTSNWSRRLVSGSTAWQAALLEGSNFHREEDILDEYGGCNPDACLKMLRAENTIYSTQLKLKESMYEQALKGLEPMTLGRGSRARLSFPDSESKASAKAQIEDVKWDIADLDMKRRRNWIKQRYLTGKDNLEAPSNEFVEEINAKRGKYEESKTAVEDYLLGLTEDTCGSDWRLTLSNLKSARTASRDEIIQLKKERLATGDSSCRNTATSSPSSCPRSSRPRGIRRRTGSAILRTDSRVTTGDRSNMTDQTLSQAQSRAAKELRQAFERWRSTQVQSSSCATAAASFTVDSTLRSVGV